MKKLQVKVKFPEHGEPENIYRYANESTPVINVGDSVKVFDGSYNKDAVSNVERHGIDPLFKKYTAKVVETDVNRWETYHIHPSTVLHTKYDLLLLFPTGEKVYCSSLCVQKCPEYGQLELRDHEWSVASKAK